MDQTAKHDKQTNRKTYQTLVSGQGIAHLFTVFVMNEMQWSVVPFPWEVACSSPEGCLFVEKHLFFYRIRFLQRKLRQ